MRTLNDSPFIWLTLSLIGMLLAGAFVEAFPESIMLHFLEWSSICLILVALLSLKDGNRRPLRFLLIFAAIVAMVLVREITDEVLFEYGYLFLLLVFFVMASWRVGRQVLFTGSADVNKIIGSIGLYIMIALIWAILYTFLVEVQPGALKGIEPGPWYENLNTTIYFSFVTLTTLGYGDISPVSHVGQVLVVLEAVTGIFYLAIIVASLMGSLAAKGTNSGIAENRDGD